MNDKVFLLIVIAILLIVVKLYEKLYEEKTRSTREDDPEDQGMANETSRNL